MGRKHERPVGGSSRMDETDIKIKGVWKPLPRCRQARQYCRLPADGHAPHNTAKSCFGKTMSASGTPDMVAMDRSGPNRAAIDEINAGLVVEGGECILRLTLRLQAAVGNGLVGHTET